MKELLKEYRSYPKLAVDMLRENMDALSEQFSYGRYRSQYYLAFFPPEGVERKKEVVFYFHGGGWTMFQPKDFAFVGKALSSLGYVTILPGYRKAPKVKYPVPVQDAACGMNAALRMLAERGVALNRMVFTGASAGGHTAAWIALNRHMILQPGAKVIGLCCMSGVTSFEHCIDASLLFMLHNLFKRKFDRNKADPIRYLKGAEDFKVLCIHGDRDPVVNNGNSKAFTARFNELNGGGAELFIQTEGAVHHSDLIVEMFIEKPEAYRVFLNWLQRI